MLNRTMQSDRVWRLVFLLVLSIATTAAPEQASAADENPTASTSDGSSEKAKATPKYKVVTDSRENLDDGAVDSMYSFVPSSGYFEMKVKCGWVGFMPIEHEGWSITECQRMNPFGVRPMLQEKIVFSYQQQQVLSAQSVGDETSLRITAAFSGASVIRFQRIGDGTKARQRCELRIVVDVEPDLDVVTTTFDDAISVAIPDARIHKHSLRGGAMLLTGTVQNNEDVSAVMEIARIYAPDVINRLVVESKVKWPSQTQERAPSAPDSVSNPKAQPSELQQLRDDVRSLRDEVRQLRELVERKLAAKPAEESDPTVDKPKVEPAADGVIHGASIKTEVAPQIDRTPLDERIDRAIEGNRTRYLFAESGDSAHSPWQIFQSVLAFGQDCQVIVSGVRNNAIDWISTTDPKFQSEPWMLRTETGAKFHPFTKPYLFEGHPGQFLAWLGESGLPQEHQFVVGGQRVRTDDFIRHLKCEVNEREEMTWVLWALQCYLAPNAEWLNKDGDRWSIERLVDKETRAPVVGAPDGGTTRLYALTRARDKYLQSGGKLRGVWLEADTKIKKHIELARSLQNNDGTFSADYFHSTKHTPDLNRRLETHGQMLEFLVISLPLEELRAPWMRSAVQVLANDLLDGRKAAASVHAIFHSLHALMLYRDRTRPRSEMPTAWNIQAISSASVRRDAQPADSLPSNASDIQEVAYPVGELIARNNRPREYRRCEPLVRRIMAATDKSIWEADGGPCRIKTDDANFIITVFADRGTQQAVAGMLQRLSREFVIDETLPSVGNIKTQRVEFDEKGADGSKTKKVVNGLGTGVLIDERGYLLTCDHVVKNVDEITVSIRVRPDSYVDFNAQVIASDPKHDLAVIKIENPWGSRAIPLGEPYRLSIGQSVMAIGNAYGRHGTVNAAPIVALGREVSMSDWLTYKNLIQVDTSLVPGDSGGPMIDEQGRIVGLNVAIRANGNKIGFAMAIDDVRKHVAKMMGIEQLNSASHGLKLQTARVATGYQLIVEGSDPSTKSELQSGDVIKAVQGKPALDELDFERSLLDLAVGQQAKITFVRNNQTQETNLTLIAAGGKTSL